MDLSKLPIFKMMSERLDWLGARQGVLAKNVSNADTPGYQARDLAPQDFKSLLKGNSLKVNVSATNPAHFSDHSQSSRVDLGGHKIPEKDNYDTSVTGNSVSIEDQMVRMSENSMDHGLTLNLMKKYVAMYRESLGRR